jgi:pimeloyl-ACP methyl ester carboxylesterase
MQPWLQALQMILLVLVGMLASATVASAQDIAASRFATTADGQRIRYTIRGTGRDTVLVPLAAWLERALDTLTQDRVVVFYDPRGRGGSSRPAEASGYGASRDAADIEDLRVHAQLGSFAIVGAGYYASVAAIYAAQFPARVRRLVMIAPERPAFASNPRNTARPRERLDPTLVAALDLMKRTGRDTIDRAGYCRADLFARALPAQMGEPDFIARMKDDPCRFPNEWPARRAATQRLIDTANGRWDWRMAAIRVSSPALVIVGAEDPVTSVASGRDWARRMRNARAMVILGAGHAPWLDGNPVFTEALLEFLDGSWPSNTEVIRAPR